jgi:hypothetical protein
VSSVNKKRIGIVATLLAVLFVVNQPDKSAGLVRNAMGGLNGAGHSLMHFLDSLAA